MPEFPSRRIKERIRDTGTQAVVYAAMDGLSAAKATITWLRSAETVRLHHSWGTQRCGNIMSTTRHHRIPRGCSLETQALETSQVEGGQDLAPLACSARAGRHTQVQWQVASLNALVAPSQPLCRMCCYFNRTYQHSFWLSVCGLFIWQLLSSFYPPLGKSKNSLPLNSENSSTHSLSCPRAVLLRLLSFIVQYIGTTVKVAF